ncbi:hypothetical protein HanRHA438_Chr08g0339841 [Helianthus annuus]|nr:hypothetical protein HanRHA438_Chr08g0339841 [Helianthus annuus]
MISFIFSNPISLYSFFVCPHHRRRTRHHPHRPATRFPTTRSEHLKPPSERSHHMRIRVPVQKKVVAVQTSSSVVRKSDLTFVFQQRSLCASVQSLVVGHLAVVAHFTEKRKIYIAREGER